MTRTTSARGLRMVAERCAVVLIDYQEKLIPAMHSSEQVIARTNLVAGAAQLLGVPVLATEQNPSRLGGTVAPLAARLDAVLDKMHFGAVEAGVIDRVDELAAARSGGAHSGGQDAGRAGEPADIVISGCEAHVCLAQTALGLLEAGRRVWVVADASGSRRPTDHEAAMRRLAAAGATVVTSEMVVFEWLHTCENEQFKAVSALVKATPLD